MLDRAGQASSMEPLQGASRTEPSPLTPECHEDRENKNMVKFTEWLWGLIYPVCPSSPSLTRLAKSQEWGPPSNAWPGMQSTCYTTIMAAPVRSLLLWSLKRKGVDGGIYTPVPGLFSCLHIRH